MPKSYHPLGKFFGRNFRNWCTKHIAKEIGKGINVEKGASIHAGVVLKNGANVGVDCLIGQDTIIGENVIMAPECQIYTQNKKFNKEIKRFEGYEKVKPVIIGDNCWLGTRVLIMPGVTIGEGCVIAAGAVVSKSMPPFSVVAGNPAKAVKNLLA
ncbi:acyltransferase [Lacticigenium naphthae]|uniref:acyltransferase n=1 Tax=Lacticigenium naphthae TaxID=515351 RepID=UPI0003FA9DCD|nr:acyltransferase [Lacticigenium naphthae]